MKILLVLEATLGGTARHILDLSSALLALDHEVHLVYSLVRADLAFNTGLASLQSHPQFHGEEIAMRREPGLSDFRCWTQLRSYVRRNGPFHVLHGHSTKAGLLARLIRPRKGAATIYTPHGLMTQNPQMGALSRMAVSLLESMLSVVSDAVIAVSELERQCAIRTGMPARKLTVIPNGISPLHQPKPETRDVMRTRLGLAPGTVCIGSIGLLVPNKEPHRLLEAFNILRTKTHREVCLVVIGWGPLENDLRAYVAQQGLTKSVRILGQVSGIEHFPAFDILAHSSRYEGFAYVFLEAMSLGIPIVTTRVGGADEVVNRGAFGAICDPWNPQEFASLLQHYVENPERANQSALTEIFSAGAMARSTLALYTASQRPASKEVRHSTEQVSR